MLCIHYFIMSLQISKPLKDRPCEIKVIMQCQTSVEMMSTPLTWLPLPVQDLQHQSLLLLQKNEVQ